VTYQINPHYLDPDPGSPTAHKAETRERTYREFLEENETPVVGLREGSILRVEDGITTLLGGEDRREFFGEDRIPVGDDAGEKIDI